MKDLIAKLFRKTTTASVMSAFHTALAALDHVIDHNQDKADEHNETARVALAAEQDHLREVGEAMAVKGKLKQLLGL